MRAIIAYCLLLCAAAGAAPQTAIRACATPPVLDGALNDPCWRRAAPASDFYVLPSGARSQDTTAKFAYDNTWLYIAVECQHAATRAAVQTIFAHDDSVHTDESIEVFFDPGTNGKLYFHFKLSMWGVKAEQRCIGAKREPQWDSPWLSAVKAEPQRWTAEIAIPLYVLASYGDLTKARVNVTRNYLVPEIDAQGVTVSHKRQLTSWARMQRSFHEPDNFGALTGLHVKGLQTPLLPSFSNQHIGGYYFKGGRYCYDVLFDVRGHNPRKGVATITILDKPISGKESELSQQIEIDGMIRQEVKVSVRAAAPVQRSAIITMADPKTGAIWRTSRVADMSSLDMMAVYLDRTFYTTETHAVAVCAFGMPEEALRGTTLRVLDAQGKTLSAQAGVAAHAQLPFPIAGLPYGRHKVTITLTRGGETLVRQDLTLAKLTPKPGREWKIDKINKVLLHDGKPFFPFGLLMAGVNSSNTKDIKRAADAGFNTIAHWALALSPREAKAYAQAAKAQGLYVLARIEAYAKRGVDRSILAKHLAGEKLEAAVKATRSAGVTHLKGALISAPGLGGLSRAAKTQIFSDYCNANRERMLDAVRACMDMDNVIGFNHFDEPILSVFDQDVAGRALYDAVHETDGYHPIFLLYSSHIPKGDRALDWCDALGTDPYWIPARVTDRNTPNFVSKIVAINKRRSDARQKMTWIVPMAEFWSGVHKRAILPREQFCQTYLALIHGAKCLLYFRYPILHQTSWDTLTAVAQQLKVLGPIAVTPDVDQQVSYQPGEFDPDKDKYPDVQACLRRRPEGGYVLLAANSRHYPVEVRFHIPGAADGVVTRLFAGNRYALRTGAFDDHLDPYGVRAYVLPPGTRLAEPARLDVRMRAHPEAAGKLEIEIPRSGRAGKRNRAPNPSFEEASLPGWPDYYRPWYSEPLIGNPDAGWRQDTTAPYHGRHCLRITKSDRRYNGFYFYCGPQHNSPTRYVFSVYLRAQRPGLRVYFLAPGFKTRRFALTTDWKRYSFTGVVPARANSHYSIYVRLIDTGVIWADAVQFEIGDEPTAFED